MNFFLADDTIEVKETIKTNSGKDSFPLLIRRAKVPKKPILTHYPVLFFFAAYLHFSGNDTPERGVFQASRFNLRKYNCPL